MNQVSKNMFYDAIGPIDCSPRVRGNYEDDDYGSDFVTPQGVIVGRTVRKGPTPHHKPETLYYLPSKWPL